MINLKAFIDYRLGNTPIVFANKYSSIGNLYVKLEMLNPNKSIKDRVGYYIVKDLIDTHKLKEGVNLVESSSGNLGLSLAYFAKEVGVRFLCLIDPTIPAEKIKELEDAGAELNIVQKGNLPDYRTARIHLASELNKQRDWIWTNQYDNLANYRAHFETTGPEIWKQMNGKIDYVICSVGTGGTICGVGNFIKKCNPKIKIIAVEPSGSTIFGGQSSNYLSVGTGMVNPSGIILGFGKCIDYFCKIDDADAIQECLAFKQFQSISVGISTGSVLKVGKYLATKYPDKNIVVIAPDGGASYETILKSNNYQDCQQHDVALYSNNIF